MTVPSTAFIPCSTSVNSLDSLFHSGLKFPVQKLNPACKFRERWMSCRKQKYRPCFLPFIVTVQVQSRLLIGASRGSYSWHKGSLLCPYDRENKDLVGGPRRDCSWADDSCQSILDTLSAPLGLPSKFHVLELKASGVRTAQIIRYISPTQSCWWYI